MSSGLPPTIEATDQHQSHAFGPGSSVRSKVVRRWAGVALVGALLAEAVASPGVATAKGDPEPRPAVAGQDRPELSKALEDVVALGFAGVQMRVRDERGEWVGSAGVRKLGEAAKPPTNGRFRVGSATKAFVTTVVLQLVAEGKVGLDAPAADYLPQFELDRRITVRMLLQNTSGLFNYTGEYYPDDTFVPGVPAKGQEWVETRFHTYRPEELVRVALSKPPRFEPGKGWSYSNTNHTLAALLIEQVTDRPYAEEIERRILRPLKLSGTFVPGARTQIFGPHAHGYYRYQDDAGQWKVVDVTSQSPTVLAGAGEMISTTEDLSTFLSALLGGKLLPPPLLAQMLEPHPESPIGYGLGLSVQDLGQDCGGTVVNINGSPPGGYGALTYSTVDGTKTMSTSVTMGDAPIDPSTEGGKAVQLLLNEVFCK